MLGLLLLAVVWGPWIYTELVRTPEQARGRTRHGFAMFSDDEAEGEEPAAEAEPEVEESAEEPAAPAAEASKEHAQAAAEPDPTKAAQGTTAEPGATKAADKGADKGAETAEAAEEPEEEPRPTWPSELAPAFRKTFDAEPRDGFWAQTEEPKLRALLRTAGVEEHSVGEVACRKTVCRVAFSLEDLESDVENKLFEDAQKQLGLQLALDDKHSAAHAALYVLRKGYQLDH